MIRLCKLQPCRNPAFHLLTLISTHRAEMNTTAKPKEAIQLKYSGGRVVVETDDEDRFVMSAIKAVEACVSAHRQDEAIRVFKTTFLGPLHAWCISQASRVQACYVIPVDKHIDVFVVGLEERYDFDLGREISNLESQFYDSGWRVSVQQIPHGEAEERETFYNSGEVLEVYAVGQ